ncbi:MAG TPA: AMP-binding protein [Actinomycetota bacterium]
MGGANLGLGSWIARRARASPSRAALVSEERSLTYAELDERIRRLANALVAMGVQPGDRVGYVGPNHPSFLETLFATGTVGGVFVPINPALPHESIAFELGDAGCRVLFQAAGVGGTDGVPMRVVVGPSYDAVVADARADPVERSVGLDHLAVLPYTSGTTGSPKGVMLTHGNLTWNVVNMLAAVDFGSGEATLATAPLFRMGGLGVTVLETLFVGGTVVLMARPDPEDALDLIERHRIGLVFAGPDILGGLTRSPRWEHADLSSVRICITGGTTVPERLIRAFLDRGLPLNQGYGLTEASPVVSILGSDDMLRKLGSAGTPAMLCDVRVVNEDLTDAPPGHMGEILIRGPNVTVGYWRRPDAAPFTDDGWLRTGDAGRLDDEGFLYMVDRVADAYTVDGRRVFPSDVERALLEHPAVADCAVTSVPDRAAIEVGVAFVVVEAGASADGPALLEFARERLPRPEVLGRVELVDAIPRNPVGKVLRRELRGRPRAD